MTVSLAAAGWAVADAVGTSWVGPSAVVTGDWSRVVAVVVPLSDVVVVPVEVGVVDVVVVWLPAVPVVSPDPLGTVPVASSEPVDVVDVETIVAEVDASAGVDELVAEVSSGAGSAASAGAESSDVITSAAWASVGGASSACVVGAGSSACAITSVATAMPA
jgi:hypothetical protein